MGNTEDDVENEVLKKEQELRVGCSDFYFVSICKFLWSQFLYYYRLVMDLVEMLLSCLPWLLTTSNIEVFTQFVVLSYQNAFALLI